MNMHMRNLKIIVFAVLLSTFCLNACLFKLNIYAEGLVAESDIRPSELYARSAVLMDADSGRILFAKNPSEEMPMASTTKIMTCILALEKGKMKDCVTVSDNAASQPEVKLGMKSGQSYYLQDLLYSLMLESHNDTAVAIAEHIGGSVPAFADMMNKKAKEIGCDSTYFITPNGLDARDEKGIHHTTAEDLASIMRYCVTQSRMKDEFIKITGTADYSFTDCEGSVSYSCVNHNAFLKMMEGAFSGKTGFTADAGYCYTGALRRGERKYIVALLACGWPNNKGYKWADTIKLMNYGLDNYRKTRISSEDMDTAEKMVPVKNGYKKDFPGKGINTVNVSVRGEEKYILLKEDEKIDIRYEIPSVISAPVHAGQKLGEIVCYLEGEKIASYAVLAKEDVMKRTLRICLNFLIHNFSSFNFMTISD